MDTGAGGRRAAFTHTHKCPGGKLCVRILKCPSKGTTFSSNLEVINPSNRVQEILGRKSLLFWALKRVRRVYTAPVPPLGDWVSEAPPSPPPPTMNEDESFSGGGGNPSAEKTEDLFACRRGMNIRGEKLSRHTSTLAEASFPRLLAGYVNPWGCSKTSIRKYR